MCMSIRLRFLTQYDIVFVAIIGLWYLLHIFCVNACIVSYWWFVSISRYAVRFAADVVVFFCECELRFPVALNFVLLSCTCCLIFVILQIVIVWSSFFFAAHSFAWATRMYEAGWCGFCCVNHLNCCYCCCSKHFYLVDPVVNFVIVCCSFCYAVLTDSRWLLCLYCEFSEVSCPRLPVDFVTCILTLDRA